MKKHISYSELKTWAECPYKRKLSYQDRVKKFVGNQFLDNTSNEDRMIESYLINDLRLAYKFQAFGMQKIELNFLINNLLNVTYESNGYTWGYLSDGSLYQQNNYYPQAGINFLMGISLKF